MVFLSLFFHTWKFNNICHEVMVTFIITFDVYYLSNSSDINKNTWVVSCHYRNLAFVFLLIFFSFIPIVFFYSDLNCSVFFITNYKSSSYTLNKIPAIPPVELMLRLFRYFNYKKRLFSRLYDWILKCEWMSFIFMMSSSLLLFCFDTLYDVSFKWLLLFIPY